MKQTIEIMTTISGNESEFATPFLNFIESLTNYGWSLNVVLSEGGGCWQISGHKYLALHKIPDRGQ